ncbi:MAG TPA: metallophosphoesterase [Terriglobales bacterium]|nr:metallophosphoesterase [Terriglobales bacterium]
MHPIVVTSVEQLENVAGTTRREFLRRGLIAGGGMLALGSYASVFEPRHVVVRSVELTLARLPEAFAGIRIAHISDIHFEDYLPASHVENVVELTNQYAPDLVVLTGDFVSRPWNASHKYLKPAAMKAAACAPILTRLKAGLGRFAVLGNHDASTQPDIVTDALMANGIETLRNRAVPVERAGARIWMAGVDDVVENLGDIPKTFSGVPRGELAIALVHEPDPADEVVKYGADLQLSGHSHGGQVRIPFVGAPVLPSLGKKYPLGWYKIGNMQLYTNPGIGVVGLPFRFDCPPEITVFTLQLGT